MKKVRWRCVDNNGCPSKCEFETTIGKPDFCPVDGHSAKWEEITEEHQKQDETVTDCNQLTTNCSQLPDWCKAGEYVWCDRNGYGKIHSVREDKKSCAIYFRHGGGEFPLKAFLNFKQARVRQWMPEEAIGKVVVTDENYYIISAADKYTALIGNTFIKMDELLSRFKQPDGSPCGVLEHLEDGELVK